MGAAEGFDVAFNVVRASDSAKAAEQVREFAEAGGTWWVELAPDEETAGFRLTGTGSAGGRRCAADGVLCSTVYFAAPGA